MSATQSTPKTEPEKDVPAGPTAADVAKLIGGTIRVPGKTQGAAVERKLEAGDVLAFRVDGDVIRATTADGRKHAVPAKGAR